MTSFRRALIPTVLLLTALSAPARANQFDQLPHLRPLDREMRELLFTAIDASPSFRLLVDRINASDVIVYIRCGRGLRSGISGQMTFVGASGGLRYVIVAIDLNAALDRQIAILGHELRHAVEVADTPSIVDTKSLGVAYTRMGHSTKAGVGMTLFDTHDAVAAGEQVWREVMRPASRGE